MKVWTNGIETVIAADPEDAWAVWMEHSGEKREDYSYDGGWSEVTGRLEVGYEDRGDVVAALREAEAAGADPNSATVIMRIRGLYWLSGEAAGERWAIGADVAWWAQTGRGFLCSAEW